MRFMLDTNTVSHLLKGHPSVALHTKGEPIGTLCISAITEGELSFGLAKRPEATRFRRLDGEFHRRVETLPWHGGVATHYGEVRASMEREGKNMGSLDMLIAAHALEAKIVLVTNDQAFHKVPGLEVEDWTKE